MDHLTFGEFCFLVVELQEQYSRRYGHLEAHCAVGAVVVVY